MKQNKIKPIPRFENEDQERDFWATHSSTDYFDMRNEVKFDFSKLKLTNLKGKSGHIKRDKRQ